VVGAILVGLVGACIVTIFGSIFIYRGYISILLVVKVLL